MNQNEKILSERFRVISTNGPKVTRWFNSLKAAVEFTQKRIALFEGEKKDAPAFLITAQRVVSQDIMEMRDTLSPLTPSSVQRITPPILPRHEPEWLSEALNEGDGVYRP